MQSTTGTESKLQMLNTKNLLAALTITLLATACGSQKPEDQVKSAKEYLQKQDNKSATIQLKNALQQNPNLGEARFLMGSILLQEGDAAGAEIEFGKAIAAKHPEDVVVPELARAMIASGQAKKLVEQFGSTRFKLAAADASLQTSLATAQAVLGKKEAAGSAVKSALAVDPTYVPALILAARLKAGERDIDGALQAMEEILSKAPESAEAWKLKGDLLNANSKTDDALIAYRKSLTIDSKSAPIHLAILRILLQKNKHEEATKQLEELKKIAPKNPETKYIEAQLAYQKKDYKTARTLAQELLRISSKNSQILQLAGAIEFQTNSLSQAEAYLKIATGLNPNSVLSQKLLIATYLRSGQPGKALTALNNITSKNGLDPRFFAIAGQVYLQNGDSKTAETYLGKALKLDPDNMSARTSLAAARLASGQHDDGFNELQEISDSDSSTMADMVIISAHLSRKEFSKALAAVDKLETKQPDKPIAANLRGRIQLAQKDVAAARKSFEKALAIDPSFFAAAASLASLDMADKNPAAAKSRFERMLALNPKNGSALLALAQLATMQGAGKEEVAALLTKAVEANPTEAGPRLLLIELHLKSNELKLAAVAAQSAVSAMPTSPEMLNALGRVQSAAGDVNQAAATYIKLVTLQPLSPQAHLSLAGAQHAKKDLAASEQSLLKALEIKPDFLDAQRGLILLRLESKKFREAAKVALTVQEQRPQSPVGFLLEGDIARAQENPDLAATAYKSGLQRAASTDLAYRLYSVLLQSKKTGEAEKFAATWLKDHPKDTAFLTYLGDAAIGRKDYAAAEIHYLSLLKIQPENVAALNNVAWVMGQQHKDGALAFAEKANQLAPNKPTLMDTMAMLYADRNEYSKAIEIQKKASELQPSNSFLRLGLAKIYIKSGDKDRARVELEAIAKLGDKFQSQAEVSALLKSL